MDEKSDPWPSSRLFHLTGGVRAYNLEGPDIDFEPLVVGGKKCVIHVKDYASAFGHIQRLGLKIVGVDYYTHSGELRGEAPPSWRYFNQGWPTWELGQKWAQISHAGFNRKAGRLWDLASRLSQQVRTCDWQLRQVSQSYEAQLIGRTKQGDVKDGQRFADGFTGLAYIAIQSYLADACTLRDYLAEFLAHVIWEKYLKPGETVDSMATLRNTLLSRIPRPDPLADYLAASVSNGAWLKRLSDYRNLVVHTAPLAMAGGRWFAVIEHQPLADSGLMPLLRIPLPLDPATVKKERSSGSLFNDFNAQQEAFTKAVRGQVPWTDGLDYLWEVHGQLADLTSKVADSSPVKGEMMHFDESDLRGPIRVITR